MNLGENIYKLRTSRKMSQDTLAEALEVSRQSVSKWENNMAVPDLDKLIRMRDLFGITLDELVAEEPPEPGEEPASEPVIESKPSILQLHKRLWIAWGVYLLVEYLLQRVFLLFDLTIPSVVIHAAVLIYTLHYFRNTPFPFSRIGKSMLVLCGCVAYFFGIRLFSFSSLMILDLLEVYEQYYLVIVIFHISVTVLIHALISWLKRR